MGSLVSQCFESGEEWQAREADERERECERERLRCERVERERQQAFRRENWERQQARQRLLREREDAARREQYREADERERECERERLRCERVERERQQAFRRENWERQQARQRLREDAARREQYRQQLLHYDGPAVVPSSDGTFVEFRLLNTRVALKLFDEVPRGALLTFTQDLHAHSKKWSTHMVGKFQCKQQKGKKNRKGGICSSWTSGKIYTEIFFQDPNHPHDSYKAMVRVWTQCCRNCNAKVLPRMEEDIYSERVISRLRLWMGLRSPIHVEKSVPSGLPPHRRDLCSACKAGKCQMTLRDWMVSRSQILAHLD